MYYADKTDVLARLFGTPVEVTSDDIRLAGRRYPVVDDVIVVLPDDRRPATGAQATRDFSPEVQRTFGAEWHEYSELLPEHRNEFDAYFDLVELTSLDGQVVADLGCGMGRWSHFVAPHCASIVLVDFSDAIFVARRNLADTPNAVFVMGDITELPFADDAFDFAFSLGVLHTVPIDALDATARFHRLTPRLLVYLHYALDNRPAYFRPLLGLATAIRRRTARITDERVRRAITDAITFGVYLPLVALGRAAARLGVGVQVPLADTYVDKSARRIRQDVYDRFFTPIEQRFSRREILDGLSEVFPRIEVSPDLPYWHFLCER